MVLHDASQEGLNQRLMSAAIRGDANAVSTALRLGAEVGHTDSSGATALHLSAAQGAVGAIAVLVEAGGDPRARDRWNRIPLHEAASRGWTAAVGALLQAEGDALALPSDRRAANLADHSGRTAIHEAAVGGFPSLTELLLKAGGDQSLRDGQGMTPIEIAQGLARLELQRQNDRAFERLKASERQRQDQEQVQQQSMGR